MNTIYRLTTLFALTLSALGADVKFSALPTATSPSTNSYLPIIDLNLLPAAQNEKYLLTNLATVAQLNSSTNSLTNSFVLKSGDTMTGALTSAVNFVVTPSPQTFAASSPVNFAESGMRTMVLTTNATFYCTNMYAGSSVSIRITNSTASVLTLAFDSALTNCVLGSALPTQILPGKVGLCTWVSWGTTIPEMTFTYAVQP